MRNTAFKDLDHVRRAGDMDPEIASVYFVRDSFEITDKLSGIFGVSENNDVARFPVLRDQQPAPERTGDRVLNILRSVSQTLDRGDAVDCFHLLSELLHSGQI